MLEEITHPTHDQLESTLRENLGIDHRTNHQLGEKAGRGRWFHDGRHPRQECRRQLLQHAPHREIEGVDVDGHALQRNADMATDEGSPLGKRLEIAVDVKGLVRELSTTFARIDEESADAAFNVDPGVALGRASRR